MCGVYLKFMKVSNSWCSEFCEKDSLEINNFSNEAVHSFENKSEVDENKINDISVVGNEKVEGKLIKRKIKIQVSVSDKDQVNCDTCETNFKSDPVLLESE